MRPAARDLARTIHADRVEEREKAIAATRVETHDPIDRIEAAMKRSVVPRLQPAWDLGAEVIDFLTGRRVGKTEMIVRKSLVEAAKNARTINPIIYPTAKTARDTAWKPLLRARQEYFPDARVRGDQVEITPYGGDPVNAGTVLLGGCETASDVGKWFGKPFALGVCDEMGNFGPHVEELISDGLEPGMMDFQGKLAGGASPALWRSGNPGLVLEGFWYDATGPSRSLDDPTFFTGDARDNPYINNAEAYFRRILKRKRWDWKTPTFVRMYLGQWCLDEGVLVYPIGPKNLVDLPFNEAEGRVVLPTKNPEGFPLPLNKWRFGIGCDTGQVDLFTAVVHASHPALYEEYIVHAEGHASILDDEKAQIIERLRERFPGAAVVVDPGGGGKHLIQTLQRRNKIPAIVAYKPHKAAGIRETRDGLLSGWLKVLNHECTRPLRDELSVLGWDDDKVQHSKKQADHFADGMLYIVRYAAHYRSDPEKFKPRPKPGSAEAREAAIRAMILQGAAKEARAIRARMAKGRPKGKSARRKSHRWT